MSTPSVDTSAISTLSDAFRTARSAGYDVAKNGSATFDPDDVDQYYDFAEGDPEVYASINDSGMLIVQAVDTAGIIQSGEALVVFSRSAEK
ncbi:hypothetical protein [Corallococcus exiguus]|uniref:hypothetical protein n=1 Tax=Corallococcus exiguus TaxID=83462 RepID=UPI001471DD7E|nr:hypothetical protein [Corallococcus exiguus]NNB89919.1 hypothetical protein [Corallococcus exiguus]